ncbi:MAG: zinc metalloprotease HtpX [Candidatus Omnitrophota bacterium]
MNYAKTAILIILLTVILMAVGSLLGGVRGAFIAFLFALLLNGVSYWYSDKIILTMYKARVLSKKDYPRLYKTVEELSGNAGIPCPGIYIAEMKASNAFATGRDPEHSAVCLTRGIIELLNENQLRGVVSHELAHIRNRDTLIMTLTAALASAVMMIAYMARWGLLLGGFSRDRRDSSNIVGVIAVSIVAPIAALLVQMAISRSREYAADALAAGFSKDPESLADALENLDRSSKQNRSKISPATAHLFIVRPFSKGFISNLFSTHPPIAERAKRLRSMA